MQFLRLLTGARGASHHGFASEVIRIPPHHTEPSCQHKVCTYQSYRLRKQKRIGKRRAQRVNEASDRQTEYGTAKETFQVAQTSLNASLPMIHYLRLLVYESMTDAHRHQTTTKIGRTLHQLQDGTTARCRTAERGGCSAEMDQGRGYVRINEDDHAWATNQRRVANGKDGGKCRTIYGVQNTIPTRRTSKSLTPPVAAWQSRSMGQTGQRAKMGEAGGDESKRTGHRLTGR